MKKSMLLIAGFLISGSASFAGPEENFAKWDKNQDGVMQKEEFVAMRESWGKDPAETEKFFKAKDKDGDGALSKEEFLADSKKKKQ